MASAWNVSWGSAWGQSWGFLPVPTIDYQRRGGDDAPKRKRTQHDREKALSDALERTMQALHDHPRAVAAVASSVAETREAERLRRRHEAVDTLLKTRQAEEQDEEEWILMA